MRTMMTVAALAILCGCCGTSNPDVAAERAAFDMVTEAAVDREGGPVDVSWDAYLDADERLTPRERQRFRDFLGAWEQRVEAGEALQAGGGQ